jgi:hypothetical protein
MFLKFSNFTYFVKEVDPTGLEPVPQACKASVPPTTLRTHKVRGDQVRFEPTTHPPYSTP